MKNWGLIITMLLAGIMAPAWAQRIDSASPASPFAPSFSLSGLFSQFKSSIYQILVINEATSQKTSIGSGFIVGDGTLLATNYHVISDAIQAPHRRLEYLDSAGNGGALELVNVDVVHDLALVKANKKFGDPLQLGEIPAQGDSLYSLGDPHDLGFIIIEGTNNGLLQKSAQARILFSGSLNAGMSGGPTLDQAGKVIGVNVSYLASGNNISFIVPAQYLQTLIDQSKSGNIDINQSITKQLFEDNKHYYEASLKDTWPTAKIGPFTVPLAMREDVRCWDSSPQVDADDIIAAESVSCFNDRSTFISDQVSVGQFGYSYAHYHALKPLSAAHFYHVYSQANQVNFSPRPKKDYTSYACHADFVNIADKSFKLTLCVLPSKHFQEEDEAIEDIRAVAAQIGEKNSGFVITIAMNGVQRSLGRQVIEHILEQVSWQK